MLLYRISRLQAPPSFPAQAIRMTMTCQIFKLDLSKAQQCYRYRIGILRLDGSAMLFLLSPLHLVWLSGGVGQALSLREHLR